MQEIQSEVLITKLTKQILYEKWVLIDGIYRVDRIGMIGRIGRIGRIARLLGLMGFTGLVELAGLARLAGLTGLASNTNYTPRRVSLSLDWSILSLVSSNIRWEDGAEKGKP